jgi:exodeoxyribonuclease V
VIVVDEASMVNDQTVADLLALDIPILAMGNAAQLPPVSGAGSLTAGEPDAFLTEIHRQAQGNPIVQLSMLAREGRPLRRGIYGDSHVVGADDRRRGPQQGRSDPVRPAPHAV